MEWNIEKALAQIERSPARWLVTGAAGFIGSHLVQALLSRGQVVYALDNLSTGKIANIEAASKDCVKQRFSFMQAEIQELSVLLDLCSKVDYVLHQAALGSVPRSIEDPLATHASNVTGTLNVLEACRRNEVKRLVFASSSSVYGDIEQSPKVEVCLGKPLSPYALSKLINEQYADVFSRAYDLQYVALRYFNVFGPRQDPAGQYAAVIPRWIGSLLQSEQCVLYGDGSTTRDFCYIDNVVQANILAATVPNSEALNRAYNIACGSKISLLDLYGLIRDEISAQLKLELPNAPKLEAFRAGDILHSLADINLAKKQLGYKVKQGVPEGLSQTVGYFVRNRSAL